MSPLSALSVHGRKRSAALESAPALRRDFARPAVRAPHRIFEKQMSTERTLRNGLGNFTRQRCSEAHLFKRLVDPRKFYYILCDHGEKA